jgi:hypothetical protein
VCGVLDGREVNGEDENEGIGLMGFINTEEIEQ